MSATESNFQFEVNIARGEEYLPAFDLFVGYTCHDSVGNEVIIYVLAKFKSSFLDVI